MKQIKLAIAIIIIGLCAVSSSKRISANKQTKIYDMIDISRDFISSYLSCWDEYSYNKLISKFSRNIDDSAYYMIIKPPDNVKGDETYTSNDVSIKKINIHAYNGRMNYEDIKRVLGNKDFYIDKSNNFVLTTLENVSGLLVEGTAEVNFRHCTKYQYSYQIVIDKNCKICYYSFNIEE